MLTQGLPQVGPHSRHATNGIDYGFTDALLWRLVWTLTENTVVTAQAAGSKKTKMPSPTMPAYPWEKPDDGNEHMGGDLGDNTQEEVLEFLANL